MEYNSTRDNIIKHLYDKKLTKVETNSYKDLKLEFDTLVLIMEVTSYGDLTVEVKRKVVTYEDL